MQQCSEFLWLCTRHIIEYPSFSINARIGKQEAKMKKLFGQVARKAVRGAHSLSTF